jgi:hypothetical protein
MRRRIAGGLLLLALVAPAARAAECAGVILPERSRVGGVLLRLNGVGLREAVLGIDVYVAGLYLPAPERDARRIIASRAPRELRIRLLRDVASADMATNIERSFRRAAGEEFAHHEPSLRRLVALIPALAEGDTFAVAALPDGGVRIAHGERVLGEVGDPAFARTLFAIWLGEPPLSERLRAGLLGGGCTP